ncbi:MAG: hypothetical protein WAL66_17015, partial [Nitrososphaeraceae archaeon]
MLVASTIIIPALIAKPSFAQIASHKENVVLTPIFVQLDNKHQLGKLLLERALAKLKPMYPKL